jgi:hypothetical protein
MLFGVTVILYFVNIFDAITETKKNKFFSASIYLYNISPQVSKFHSKGLYEHVLLYVRHF